MISKALIRFWTKKFQQIPAWRSPVQENPGIPSIPGWKHYIDIFPKNPGIPVYLKKPNFSNVKSETTKKIEKFWNREVSKPKRHTLILGQLRFGERQMTSAALVIKSSGRMDQWTRLSQELAREGCKKSIVFYKTLTTTFMFPNVVHSCRT